MSPTCRSPPLRVRSRDARRKGSVPAFVYVAPIFDRARGRAARSRRDRSDACGLGGPRLTTRAMSMSLHRFLWALCFIPSLAACGGADDGAIDDDATSSSYADISARLAPA